MIYNSDRGKNKPGSMALEHLVETARPITREIGGDVGEARPHESLDDLFFELKNPLQLSRLHFDPRYLAVASDPDLAETHVFEQGFRPFYPGQGLLFDARVVRHP